MSPLSPDASAILLPGRALLRAGRRGTHETRIGIGWDGALAALRQLLADTHPRSLRVGLSHHFARPHVFAPPPVRLKPDELAGWVRERLAEGFGSEAQTWRAAWQDMPPGRPIPVTTIENDRLAALEEAVRDNGLKLAGAAPWLVGAWRAHRRRLRGKSGWLVLLETDRLVLARLRSGALAAVRSATVASDPSNGLAALLARESLLAQDATGHDVWLVAPDHAVPSLNLQADYRMHVLGGGPEGWKALWP